jgi:hypothetical protein
MPAVVLIAERDVGRGLGHERQAALEVAVEPKPRRRARDDEPRIACDRLLDAIPGFRPGGVVADQTDEPLV